MAKAAGVSHSTVQRIWDAQGLRPRGTTSFRLSADLAFVARVTDVVGLFLNPPDRVVVLCVDEKSQIAVLERTQTGPPAKPDRPDTMNVGGERADETMLLAALNVLTGRLIGECHGRRRDQEFLKFLRRLDRGFPGDLVLHVISDDHGTPNRETVRKWLAGHPRFRLHFTPAGASWLNLVESWFSGLTQHLRRDGFCSVQESVAAIEEYMMRDDADVGPFVWSTTVDAVLDRVRNRGAALESSR